MFNRKLIYTFLFMMIVCSLYSQSQSRLVKQDDKGRLVYEPYTDKGDILPDFSHCGYMGGGVAIPDIGVAAIVPSPSGGDDTPLIQAKIDYVAKLKPDANGFRGVVLIKKGIYKIESPIIISSSGIVLRGEGNNKESGTVLLATKPQKYSVIQLGNSSKYKKISSSENQILDDYVPSGTKAVHVKNACQKYKVGDDVVVHRPSTSDWIRALGMDSIPPRPLAGESAKDALTRFRESHGKTDLNGTVQWLQGSKDLRFERKIVAINGDTITLDIPLTNALQKEYGGGKIYKYEFPDRISRCGVENLYGMSVFNASVQSKNKYTGEEYCSDENHANIFVSFQAIENAWVRNVNVEHFDICVFADYSAKFITAQDLSAVNPISQITGGRRYAYAICGQMILFQRCYAKEHRHEFIVQASVAGPNAFVDGYGEMGYASSETHQRWSVGCLYDNIVVDGPDAALMSVNRGWMGTGHGWTGGQIVFWNCSSPLTIVMNPPTAYNFVIGRGHKIERDINDKFRKNTIKSINSVSGQNFEYTGTDVMGDAWIEFPEETVFPKSLYYQQLKDRLGENALMQVITSKQKDIFFTEDRVK